MTEQPLGTAIDNEHARAPKDWLQGIAVSCLVTVAVAVMERKAGVRPVICKREDGVNVLFCNSKVNKNTRQSEIEH